MTDLIVHEWIEKSGGSERVLDEMVAAFPDADVYTLWNDHDRYPDRTSTESWLSRTPLRRSKALGLPFMLPTWSRKSTDSYDRVVVSSHLFAHHVGGKDPARRAASTFVYAHTPARYIWTPDQDERGDHRLVKLAASVLKPIDRAAAAHPEAYAANSAFVQDRILASWGRESTVIHPPVDAVRIIEQGSWIDALSPEDLVIFESLPEAFLLGASRFVPYKRLDLVIRAGEAAGVPVVLAGGGPERAALAEHASSASVPVRIIDRPSDALLYALYQKALAYVFPPVEDFGIMPVEAMAAGARVIVNNVGGATESVVDGVTGVHVDAWTRAELADAVSRVVSLDSADAQARAREFDAKIFRDKLLAWVNPVTVGTTE
jgi:glycosyltransferase involved in cell wall biosynthesis